jgi:hypothetical protein
MFNPLGNLNNWQHPLFWVVMAPLIIADVILRAFALWKSARAGQKYWFVALLIVNSVGILPGVYLLFFQPKKALRQVQSK